jgi:sodium-dependent dicarboxylate transporter 2/3/5
MNGKMGLITIASSVAVFLICFFILNEADWGVRVALSLTISSILLWIFEPIPFSQTAILLLILFVFFGVTEIDVILSGFSSYALFLILGGLMLGRGVNSTNLGKRLALSILLKLSSKKGGVLLGIIIIQQLLSSFIPAPVIRTALLIPIVESMFEKLKDNKQFEKQLTMGIAYGGNISSIGFLPSAIVNVISVELINKFTNVSISYMDWFIIMLPLWLCIIPITWLVLLKAYPSESNPHQVISKMLIEEKNKLNKLENNEIRAIVILSFTVLMWATQSIHDIHPAFSALFGAILLSSPTIGVVSWKEIMRVNFDLVLIVGATFSLGNALNESGTVEYVASLLDNQAVYSLFSNQYISILLLIVFVQLYHLIISNMGTAVVTLLPVTMTFATMIGLNPVMVGILTNVTLIFGFILIIESFPNIMAQTTGKVQQKDFLRTGSYLTVFSSFLTFLIAITWWEWIL